MIIRNGKVLTPAVVIVRVMEREEHETMKEMQEADYMRYVQGTIGLYDIPTEAEYLEQEQYVNTTINNLMGEEF